MRTQNIKRWIAGILALIMIAGLCTVSTVTTVNAEEGGSSDTEITVIDSTTVWSYSDDGTDPAGDSSAADYNRTSWTKADYSAAGWKSAVGSFGAKKGAIADLGSGYIPNTLLTQYKSDGSTDIEAYFFRTSVTIEDASQITAITGSVIYDDAATVYINGVKVAGFDDDSITENLSYGGSNAGTPKTGNISVTSGLEDILVNGTNIIAVEIHQGRASSSDIYFDMPSLVLSTAATSEEEETQSSINISVGSDETERNFTWYSTQSGEGTLYIAKAADAADGVMPESAAAITVTGTAATKSGYYYYQTTATGLEASTEYAYQLVNGNVKSEIYTFTTGDNDGSFSFALAGDPQIGASGNSTSDTKGWEATLNTIATSTEFSGVEFLLSVGDQVNTASDETQYDGYLEHSVLYGLATATVIGNHDTNSEIYSQHFNLPNTTAYGSTNAGGDYYFVYNGVLFMVLNSNNRSTAEHKAFMEEAIAATADQDISWKVVTFHHSIYSVASHSLEDSIIERRTGLVPVFEDLDVDVVLMGHDHVYCRTYMMDGTTPITDTSEYDDESYSSVTNTNGILYVTVNSASGSKYYDIKENVTFPYAAKMDQSKERNISRVDISDTAFTVTTYSAEDMEVIDTFTINRVPEEVTLDVNGTAAYTQEGDLSTADTSALDSSVATVTLTCDETTTTWDQAETMTDGTAVISDGNGNYLKLEGTELVNTTDKSQATEWTITTMSNGGISIGSGTYYLGIENSLGQTDAWKLVVTETAAGFFSRNGIISYTSNTATEGGISYSSDYGWYCAMGVASNAALYQKNVSTTITFTGVGVGTTSVTIGSTTYNITVSEAVCSHELTKVDQKDPTETEAGYEAYWVCSICGKMFSDAEGTQEISEPVVIPATGKTEEPTETPSEDPTEKPTDSSTDDTTQNTTTDTTTADGTTTTTDQPTVGDQSSMVMWLLVLAAAVALGGVLVIVPKRIKK